MAANTVLAVSATYFVATAMKAARAGGHLYRVVGDWAAIQLFITQLFSMLAECQKKKLEERMLADRDAIINGESVTVPAKFRKMAKQQLPGYNPLAVYRAAVLDSASAAKTVVAVGM